MCAMSEATRQAATSEIIRPYSTNAYTLTSSSESDIVTAHTLQITKFRISVEPKQDKVPSMYWLPKMHKTPYKARFIANSSFCTTT